PVPVRIEWAPGPAPSGAWSGFGPTASAALSRTRPAGRVTWAGRLPARWGAADPETAGPGTARRPGRPALPDRTALPRLPTLPCHALPPSLPHGRHVDKTTSVPNNRAARHHGSTKTLGPPPSTGAAPTKVCPAASYSPTRSPAQYHRR